MIALLTEMKEKGIKVEGERPRAEFLSPNENSGRKNVNVDSGVSVRLVDPGRLEGPYLLSMIFGKSDEVGVPFFETDDGVGKPKRSWEMVMGDQKRGQSPFGINKTIYMKYSTKTTSTEGWRLNKQRSADLHFFKQLITNLAFSFVCHFDS